MFWFNKTFRVNFDTNIQNFEKAFMYFITPQKNEEGETIPFEITGELNNKKHRFTFTDASQANYLVTITCVGNYKKTTDFLEVHMTYQKSNIKILLYMAVAGLFIFSFPQYMLFALLLIPIYLFQYLIFRIQINLCHQIHLNKLQELISGRIIAQHDDELIY